MNRILNYHLEIVSDILRFMYLFDKPTASIEMESLLDRAEDVVLGYIAKERDKLPLKKYISLEDAERRVGLKKK